MQTIELPVGHSRWTVTLRNESLVPLNRPPIPPSVEPRAAVRDAVENPVAFVPLSQALTPDDHIAVVVDPLLPQVGELLAGLLDVLTGVGVAATNVTLITPPGSYGEWWLELPDEVDDVEIEQHDPETRERLSYLAMTAAGRRIYLNRTLTDADFCVILSGTRFDPVQGMLGGAETLFPTFSDPETRDELMHGSVPGDSENEDVVAEIREVAGLFGMPLFVRVIEGEADGIANVMAGLVDTASEADRLWRERWQATVPHTAKTVIATAASTDFDSIAKALACASRVVQPGGRIILLSEASFDELSSAGDMIRKATTPSAALERLLAEKPADWLSAFEWAGAARSARLFLHSRLSTERAEELFATAVKNEDEVNQLLDAEGDVIVLPEADRLWVNIEEV